LPGSGQCPQGLPAKPCQAAGQPLRTVFLLPLRKDDVIVILVSNMGEKTDFILIAERQVQVERR
jgi:hypothetical protein